MMKILSQIEQACKNNDHALNRRLINSIESDELSSQAYSTIINYYLHEEGRFPVGYALLFIEWLLKKRKFDTAMTYITTCNQLGVAGEQIAELIYKHIIKPDELRYKSRFRKNMELLRRYGILFPDIVVDFEEAVRRVFLCANYQTKINGNLPGKEKSVHFTAYLLIDVINLEVIDRLAAESDVIYLFYDDIRKFYYLLLFEDLSCLSQRLEENKRICFINGDEDVLRKFFLSKMVFPPTYHIDLSRGKYSGIVRKIFDEQNNRRLFLFNSVKDNFKNKDFHYYKKLFTKPPSEIKIMLITSRSTEVNQHISRNWFKAFTEMGYATKLLIENESYELISDIHIIEHVMRFEPDIVFYVNHTVDTFFNDAEEIKNSLLWIMRYRDRCDLSFAEPGYDYNNMFILTTHMADVDNLHEIGIPRERLFYYPDGVDSSVFRRKRRVNRKYACDVVSVNNAGGDNSFRFQYYLGMLKEDRAKEILRDIYAELNEINANGRYYCRIGELGWLIDKKIRQRGVRITEKGKNFYMFICHQIMESFYRSKIIEWIIDSGITRNIKLWGRSWSNYNKFRAFHMGIAKHGEELYEIYHSSKIAISDSLLTLHERNFEILASGGFPLVRYTPHENDEKFDQITNYFREDEEIVLFYNKDDLLNKIQYYLDNPEDRERIAERGRNVVAEKFTNTAIAGKTMDFIKKYYAAASV